MIFKLSTEMQLIFIEDSMYLPSVYFENEIVFDFVKLPKMWFSKAFCFLRSENCDMEINYNYAPEADSSSFVEIKRFKKKKEKVSLDREQFYDICMPWILMGRAD